VLTLGEGCKVDEVVVMKISFLGFDFLFGRAFDGNACVYIYITWVRTLHVCTFLRPRLTYLRIIPRFPTIHIFF